MNHRMRWTALAVSFFLLLSACSSDSDDTTISNGTSTGGSDVALGSTDVCGFDEGLLADARDEGSVTIYTAGHTDEAITEITNLLSDSYGIEANFVRQDSSSVIQQVEAELAAGNLNADAVALAESGMFVTWAEQGTIVDAGLPDTVEFLDGLNNPDIPSVPIGLTPLGVMYNEAINDPSDLPQTYDELANYTGTVAHASPATSGTALQYAHALLNHAADGDFYNSLGANAEVLTIDSSLALAQLVAANEADIAVPAIEPAVIAAAAGGEPLAIMFPDGPVPALVSEIAVMEAAKNPAAAQVAVGVHVCTEIQSDISTTIGVRPVISGIDTPDNVVDISDRRIVVTTQNELEENREEVVAAFESGVR